MVNENIKTYMKNNGVYQWQVADEIGVSENTIIRLFRKELNNDEHEKIISAINSIIRKREEEQA